MTTVGALLASAFPCVPVRAITGGCALILAPHPDDESLGCGGLIAASCARGEPPVVAVLTDGAGSHPRSRSHPAPALRALREAETLAAVQCLGLAPDRVVFLRHPDTRAPAAGPAFDAAVDQVAGLLARAGARALLASWRTDPHCDHEAASLIAAAAAARAGVPHRAYPVWGRTLPPDTAIEPARAVRLDVAAHRAAKRRAILSHCSQWAGLITDDPAGFQMRPDFLALFDTAHELYLEAS